MGRLEKTNDTLIVHSNNGEKHVFPTTPGSIIPEEGYSIHTFGFCGERGKTTDGCQFVIEPHKSTTVMRVIDPNAKMEECATEQDGFFLGCNPDGEIECYWFKPSSVTSRSITYDHSWKATVWIAGNKGFTVTNITEPPFNPNIEKPMKQGELDAADIPQEFWDAYHDLKQGIIPNEVLVF